MHTFHVNDRSLIPAVYSSLCTVLWGASACLSEGSELQVCRRGGVHVFQREGGADFPEGVH